MNVFDSVEAARPVTLLLAVTSVGGFAFFTFSRNTRLKRRIWPVFNIVVGMLAFAIGLSMGFPNPWMVALVPILVVIVAITVRSTRFCDACGATLQRQPVFRRADVCSKCGRPILLV